MAFDITLIRHGKPEFVHTGRIAARRLPEWIAQYDRSEVGADPVPVACRVAARAAAHCLASTAPRALSSLHALGRTVVRTDPVFCEAQLPFAGWTWPRLPAAFWAGMFRLLWMCGYAHGAESIGAARRRARQGAYQLATLAESGPVLLVGHGIMNRLIGRELRALGWRAGGGHASEHWGASVYRAAGSRFTRGHA